MTLLIIQRLEHLYIRKMNVLYYYAQRMPSKEVDFRKTSGSGKVLNYLIKHSLEQSGMTYSVNAAMKIKDSLKLLLPELIGDTTQYINKVDVANYHNFAMRILYKHGYSINSEFVHLSEFQIVNEDSEVLNSFITSSDSYKMNEVVQAVKSSDKEKILSLLDKYWEILNKKLLPNRVITYNGILISAIKLLHNKQISSFYQKYYQMVIVDEFQDTNYLGYLLIQKLIGDNKVIFLVDDVQKIYGFLGAVNGIFNLIIESYPAVEFKFCNNYRFKSNEQMKKLDLFIRDNTENYVPSKLKASVFLKALSNDLEEDAFVVKGIENIISNKGNKVAVINHYSGQSRRRQNILCHAAGGGLHQSEVFAGDGTF